MKKNIVLKLLIISFFLSSCNLEKKNSYTGYALLSYITNSDFKTLRIIMLSEYDANQNVENYLAKHSTLNGILISVKSDNPSYFKILKNAELKKHKVYDSFTLVKIDFEIENVDQKWIREEESILYNFEKKNKFKYVLYSNFKENVNMLNIQEIIYL
ncbi:hypothetical protein EG240_04800 [Paenimyroides tangerinum]|mgnify:CR=1 FL=1|uniref:Lipoprotein n=1 Tax=Paenimyroides tangerinum TaxID=2488728 RepID=A0A3P3WA63_9FLAO|nr:hypothetical protein [Paenimyroides tangerinum]RRJ91880.1 hypothetical protein EG240_04800 [Paenimyroides tangerinum]